jgi:penicillin-binding protein 1C
MPPDLPQIKQMKKISFLSTSLFLLGFLAIKTYSELRPFPEDLNFSVMNARKVQILDRHSQPLTVTYQNEWNLHDYLPLHKIPLALQQIFILAEDQHFYQHYGVDWLARFKAMYQNVKARRIVRGASTISEQTVRILHPRPRTFWSRWVETFEVFQLESRFSKAQILEFYLNQIPYAQQRRGILQAAYYYFDRDLETLNLKEMLALAILIRSPSRLDLKKGTFEIRRPMQHLANRLLQAQIISQEDYQEIIKNPLELKNLKLPVQAIHFVNHLYKTVSLPAQKNGRLQTTLDANLQLKMQAILDTALQSFSTKEVENGAVLIVDHQTREILAWVNAGNYEDNQIDAITIPRQPGSALKPFLYATALEKGWTAATLIEDNPLAEAVGTGLHNFRNYSRSFYGWLRLRDALGNSLNTPAVRTAQFVGIENFLNKLHHLGMESLNESADFYGDGLALGNGAITLFELVQAYSTLAQNGTFQSLKMLLNQEHTNSRKIFSPEISHIIGNILSDHEARQLEFGESGLFDFPIQTAIKTGTSNDYHDAWAMGFNYRYTVGVWFGNLSQRPMLNVSGATGPVLVLRSIFAELNRDQNTQPLQMSEKLIKTRICRETGLLEQNDCPSREEWFVENNLPTLQAEPKKTQEIIQLAQPVEGLHLAIDPRIPDELEAFTLRLPADLPVQQVQWIMDNDVIAITEQPYFSWYLTRGEHAVKAKVWLQSKENSIETPVVRFYVH